MLLMILAVVYAAWFTQLLRSLCAKPHRVHYVRYKVIQSVAFLAVALACAAASGAWMKWSAMQPALLLYLAGDVLLGFNNRYHKTGLLWVGSCAFLIGHLFLIAALAKRMPLAAVDATLPVLGVAAIAVILLVKKPKMPGYFYPSIPLYAAIVALMAGKCIRLGFCFPTVENVFLAIGGVLFVISDSVIPFVHLTPHRSLKMHILNLATYYGAMFAITASLYFAI